MTILKKIVDATKIRVELSKAKISLDDIQKELLKNPSNHGFRFEKALAKKGMNFICEVKKASPSKGVIVDDFDYLSIAKDYEKAGADAISVLTEPDFFMGNLQYLIDIKKEVDIPVLRKDFLIDEYQVYESINAGADAILLIASILSEEDIVKYIGIADKYGVSCLVEAHDEEELEKSLLAGARIIGVNNRNLKDFSINLENSIRLRKKVSLDKIFVSESGIRVRSDIEVLEENKVNAVLIGEELMRSNEKSARLNELRGE